MSGIIVQLGLPLLVTILFMCALRPVARGLQLIDKPGGRKMHSGDIPVIGGLAMALGVLIASVYSGASLQGYSFFVASLLLLVTIGCLDDRYDLPPSVRFLAQMCAALLMVAGAGVSVEDLGTIFFGGVVDLGWFSVPFTVLIVLTAINAFNMFDGSDGVAGSQALVSLLFIGFACLISGSSNFLPIVSGLAGCVLGFLAFNWPSRRTATVRAFMGDAGSTMLGFSLAWISIEVSQAPSRVLSPVVILWVFALPIYDLFSSMVRRMLGGQSPFHGDSAHLHHILKRRWGFSSRRVAQSVLLVAALLAGFGVGGNLAGIPDAWLFVSWLVGGIAFHYFFGTVPAVDAILEPSSTRSESVAPESTTTSLLREPQSWRASASVVPQETDRIDTI
jgi:UDP-GlcNAc:undecaprenyl-phosphate/decaprenyl-phosphate GlcNAc-1-phosphate transferase